MASEQEAEPEAKRRKEKKGIPWLQSPAREILLDDLHRGSLPVDKTAVSPEEAWDFYKKLSEFCDVPYSQFKRQLKAHREQVGRKVNGSVEQWVAFQTDQRRFPVQYHYANGDRIFQLSPAQAKLEEDVKNGHHNWMTPTALRATRPEYMEWPLDVFTQRIYQAVRQWKFINYLEKRRAEKKKFTVDDMEVDVNEGHDREEGIDPDAKKRKVK